MTISKVKPKHAAGPAVNSHDGCYARDANDGMCPGVKTAAWLNGLGHDEEKYSQALTNLDVRRNWVATYGHLAWDRP